MAKAPKSKPPLDAQEDDDLPLSGRLHLLKLCVGADSIRDQEEWIEHILAEKAKRGLPVEQAHTTRMVPKRIDELLDGGSLFWVIKGQIAARQKLLAIRPFVDKEGISRCHLVLEPIMIPVHPRPCRPFQCWRYLKAPDQPPDMTSGSQDIANMPEDLRRQLSELGLL